MNKTFLPILNTKLDEINKELELALKKQDEVLSSSFSTPKDNEKASKRWSMVHKRFDVISELIDYPSYSRIKMMSNIEIEDYKKECPYKSNEEVLKELTSKFKYLEHYKEIDDNKNKSKEDLIIDEMFLSLNYDPDKINEASLLLTNLYKLVKEKEDLKYDLDIDTYKIPNELKNKIIGYIDNKKIKEPNCIKNIIEEFEPIFNKCKDKYLENTSCDLSYFVSKEHEDINPYDGYCVLYLHDHIDKIDSNIFEELKNNTILRDELLNKVIKTKNIKNEITSLNEDITSKQNLLCRQVINWYKTLNDNILGCEKGINFDYPELLKESLKDRLDSINKCIDDINNLKNYINGLIQNKLKEEQRLDNLINEVNDKFKLLIDNKYDIKLPILSDNFDKNYNTIINRSISYEERDLIIKADKEAKYLADLKEAELKGITYQQLVESN